MTQDRVRSLVEDLERTLVAFIRTHRVTHAEYRAATDLIVAEVQAGEASLLFDVFLEAAATDVGNDDRTGSIEAIEGPFYLPDAPLLEGPQYVLPQRPDEAGVPLVFHGRVRSENGAPLAGVELDLWHADAAGEYSQIHPGIPDWNLRGRFHSDDFAQQARQALDNIAQVLQAAGARAEHIVRMTWYVTDKREYLAAAPQVGQAFRELIGHYDIAMTAVQVSALIEDRAKVEIEVTAVVPD